jgi:xanthine dehydrogenase small subunit
MIDFILNDQDISTDQPPGSTVLDFVRYYKNLKGTKIGCREGDCGACTVLVGELVNDAVKYRSMTSCLMPLANAAGKHIVTVEGINPADGALTPVQQAMVDESGTQCGFCTVGFVMSLTGFCVDDTAKTPEMAVSAVDGNICRCTGYKSIERAGEKICRQLAEGGRQSVEGRQFVPDYFATIGERLSQLQRANRQPPTANRQQRPADGQRPTANGQQPSFVGGGTDVYVQRPNIMAESDSAHLFYDEQLRGIRDLGDVIEIGGSVTVTDLLESPVMQSIFPDLYKHLKLVSSTPIRNMATLAGNFVNASPIGDMTVWFLALDAEITLERSPGGNASVNERADVTIERSPGGNASVNERANVIIDSLSTSPRTLRLRDLYLGYKQLAKSPEEIITTIRFAKPVGDFRFNFEKVCKRTYLDIATVNTAISITVNSKSSPPYEGGVDAALGGRGGSLAGAPTIDKAHVAAGGIAPIPLYLKETSAFLMGKEINAETITQANEIMQSEISPISDVRGTAEYKRLLLRQLFRAHFLEMFGIDGDII